MIGSILIYGFNIRGDSSNIIVCKLLYYTAYLCTTLSSNIFVFASIDRLLISSQNIDTRLYSSKRLAYLFMSTSICFWIIFYSHALVKIEIRELQPSIYTCYYDTSGFYFEFTSYSTLVIAAALAIALLLLSILSYKNVRQIRSIPRQNRQQLRSMHKKDFQLLRCLYAHDIIHISINGCAAVYYTYLAATKNHPRTQLHTDIDDLFLSFGVLTRHVSYCVSFFVFILLSKAFRQETKRLIYKIFGKKLVLTQVQNNYKDKIEMNIIAENVVSTIELPD